MNNNEILKVVENYYSDKIKEHGVSAKGVDWNSEESQILRFEVLLKVASNDSQISLLDYGCGYGALLNYIKSKFSAYNYIGFDISEEMLKKANEIYPKSHEVRWVSSLENETADYGVASGIFNVKFDQSDSAWKEYIENTLVELNLRSKKGFSFNMLTKYSDKEFMKDNLFYGDSNYYFDFCKKNFSKYVALLHDYPLYEFTILVKKDV